MCSGFFYNLLFYEVKLQKTWVAVALVIAPLEAYHQLRRAIALANGGEFRGNSEMELAIWNECARLVANAIIYYNGCLLSVLFKKYQITGDASILEMIKRISPIAWIHINMLGKFDFFSAEPQFDIESIILDSAVRS